MHMHGYMYTTYVWVIIMHLIRHTVLHIVKAMSLSALSA